MFLEGPAEKLTGLTIARWGLEDLCTLADYNSQPMVTLWNTVFKFRSMEIDGYKPIEILTDSILQEGKLDQVLQESGLYNTNPAYNYLPGTIWKCCAIRLVVIVVSSAVSIILLQFIDRDKR